jgi:hypothetical protein
MYYNNSPYIAQLQGNGLALNKALRTQTVLMVSLVVCGTTMIYFAIQWQKQKALAEKLKQKPATED